VRHPERVSALVAFAAVSRAYPRPREGLDERLMMETRPGNWMLRFLAAHAQGTTVSATLGAEGDLSRKELKELVAGVLDDEGQQQVVITMAEVAGDHERRREGVDNDWERFAEIDSLELERIVAPALVINGDSDADVPPEHSDHAAAAIPGAERLVMARGTHLCLYAHRDAEAAQARAIEKLKED
jgi:pimeloyl-ACP methyl ester carboxylesterase